eukprot:Sspe_Gene.113553::Locus_98178_Transcript_1_2_Confidence_0.667_Length_1121::g.113553::m.113553
MPSVVLLYSPSCKWGGRREKPFLLPAFNSHCTKGEAHVRMGSPYLRVLRREYVQWELTWKLRRILGLSGKVGTRARPVLEAVLFESFDPKDRFPALYAKFTPGSPVVKKLQADLFELGIPDAGSRLAKAHQE